MSSVVERALKVNHDLIALFERARCESDDTGEISPEVERLLGERTRDKEEVLTELGRWALATEAKLEGKQAEFAPIREAMDAEEKELKGRLEFIKTLVRQLLPATREAQIANESVYIYNLFSERTVCKVPVEALPIELTRVKREPDLKAIGEALDRGDAGIGEFAELEQRFSPQIKPGGERAMRAAKQRLKKLEAENEARRQQLERIEGQTLGSDRARLEGGAADTTQSEGAGVGTEIFSDRKE